MEQYGLNCGVTQSEPLGDPLAARVAPRPRRPVIHVFARVNKIPSDVFLSNFYTYERFCHYELADPRAIMVMAGQILCGLRFPLTSLDREVRNFYGIAPG
ncbi:hypothetical protein AQUCO_02100045v1 [Aquilegia coerulea]|uniref:Uncharacterized protein n=1 Tax=Aquilegia coerulea TaxID=218851 RepID=A0A2G5DEN4_AQUCA|nr:hypothetical protein AQUCO_02100045v1 [Aquilegia coerulea]